MGNYSQNDGNKSGNKRGRVMILVHCTSEQCVLCLKFQVASFYSQRFKVNIFQVRITKGQ